MGAACIEAACAAACAAAGSVAVVVALAIAAVVARSEGEVIGALEREDVLAGWRARGEGRLALALWVTGEENGACEGVEGAEAALLLPFVLLVLEVVAEVLLFAADDGGAEKLREDEDDEFENPRRPERVFGTIWTLDPSRILWSRRDPVQRTLVSLTILKASTGMPR